MTKEPREKCEHRYGVMGNVVKCALCQGVLHCRCPSKCDNDACIRTIHKLDPTPQQECEVHYAEPCCDGKVRNGADVVERSRPQQTTLREKIGLILDDFEIGQYEEGEAEDAILELINECEVAEGKQVRCDVDTPQQECERKDDNYWCYGDERCHCVCHGRGFPLPDDLGHPDTLKDLRVIDEKLTYPPTPQQEIERLEKVEIGSSDGWTDYKYPNFRDVHDKLNEVIDWINNHD